jgi:hypothetical protein
MKEKMMTKIRQVIKNKKIMSLIVVLVGIGIVSWKFYTAPAILRLLPVNRGSQSFSMVFMTGKPVKSCMYVYEQKLFLKGTWVCDQISSTHLLSVDGLKPQTTYQIAIKAGWRITRKSIPKVTTNPLPETAPLLPEPAYGHVKTGTDNPEVDALVVIFPNEEVARAIATKTNIQGNYAVDISPIIANAESLTVDVQATTGLWGVRTFTPDIHSPFGDITVNPIGRLEE